LVAAVAMVAATLLGFFIGLARVAPNIPARLLSKGYVELVRNLPLLLHLLLWQGVILRSLPTVREAFDLGGETGYPWDAALATLAVAGDYMTEFVFFHRASRTLILTDLIENFEPTKLGPVLRLLTWLGGVRDPDGQMPRDMRLTYRAHRAALKRAVERMIAWAPVRVILAHGRWYDRDGAAELKRAFRWLL
jgi:hypothetical protein